jgi:uncharacterized protein YaeQ
MDGSDEYTVLRQHPADNQQEVILRLVVLAPFIAETFLFTNPITKEAYRILLSTFGKRPCAQWER